MARVYVPESSKPKKDETAEEAAPVTGRVYLPASRSPKAAAKEAKAAARAEAKARAEAEAAAEDAKAKAAAGEPEPTPTPTPSTLSDESGAAPPAKPEDEPAANATTEAWAEYARTRKGASPDDLLDSDGQPLGRNALREKYGTPSQ
jgi:membrane protein involved in colicin uptake